MKKFLFVSIFAAFTYFGAAAQTSPGNSAYGHSHKKAKKAKKHYKVYNTTSAERKTINMRHKTTVRTIKENDALTNQQQKNQVRQANTMHKQEIRTVTVSRKGNKHK